MDSVRFLLFLVLFFVLFFLALFWLLWLATAVRESGNKAGEIFGVVFFGDFCILCQFWDISLRGHWVGETVFAKT